MGMGYAANRVDAVEFSMVERLCPREAAALTAVLDKYVVSQEALARCFMWEGPQDDELIAEICETFGCGTAEEFDERIENGVREITEAFEALRTAFAAATTVGGSHLDLMVGYHSEDDGDRYDDITGVYWCVDGVYQRSPAGEAFKNDITCGTFVTFG